MSRWHPECIKSLLERQSIPITETGCLIWTGAIAGAGYGHFIFKGKFQYAHRAAWELINGKIPDGKLICHTCDVMLCINPSHLFIGTHKDNTADMIKKGRARHGKPLKGAENPGAKLSAIDVEQIKELHKKGNKQIVLAKRFNVERHTISRITNGLSW